MGKEHVIYSAENGRDESLFTTKDRAEAVRFYDGNPEAVELWRYRENPDGSMGDMMDCIMNKYSLPVTVMVNSIRNEDGTLSPSEVSEMHVGIVNGVKCLLITPEVVG